LSGFKGYPPSVQVGVPFPEDVCVRVNSDLISDNIRHSISLGLKQVTPHETQWGKHICLVTGGPSLNESFDIVRERYEDGVPIVTVNGTYNYCMDSGIIPSAFIMLDSREFNNKLEGHNVWLWHCNTQDENIEILKEHYGEEYVDFFPIIGGSTVTLRSLHLLRILGFHKIEIFGFDSCIMDEHHAYPQPENDDEQEVEIIVGGRQFRCTVAHYFQAKEFVQLIGATGANYELSVHGDGLISHIIKHPESLKEAA
jgi:hypothetical protein